MKLELVPPHKQNKVVLLLKFQIKDGLLQTIITIINKICKPKSVQSLQIALLKRLCKKNEIYLKLLNLFQLSRIYNLSYRAIIVSITD